MKKLIFTILVVINSITVYCQTDTEFWFAAPEVSTSQYNFRFDRPIVLRLSAFDQASTVTISQPANTGFTPIVAEIDVNESTTIDLTAYIESLECKPANTILNYGIKISATAPISVYYEIVSAECECNPEVFVLKGSQALGTKFTIPSQNFYNNSAYANYQPFANSSFDIVATEDSTKIKIKPAKNIIGHSAGTPFSITLHKGQTYSAKASSRLATNHLGGSTVNSNKPIAITIKDDLMEITTPLLFANIGGDQIVPTSNIGTKYIVMKGHLNSTYERAFINAVKNNTEITINDILITTIQSGEIYEFNVEDDVYYIKTSKPAYLTQISGYGYEIGMELIPKININSTATEVSYIRTDDNPLFLNLLVFNGGENSFSINGMTNIVTPESFQTVPGTNWKYLRTSLSANSFPAGTNIRIVNPTPFHAGIIQGNDLDGSRFGYFTNYGNHDPVSAAMLQSEEEEEIESDISGIYPNPARDIVYITADKIISRCEIYDLLGKQTLLEIQRYDEVSSSIDVSQINSGIYFLVQYYEDGTSDTDKIIIID